MKLIAEYGVLRHQPYRNRSEHLNIGIVTFLAGGEIRVHFAANLRKLKAFDPQADLDTLRSWEHGLPEFLQNLSHEQARNALTNFGSWRLSDTLGSFSYENENEYAKRVESTLSSLVDPRGRPQKERTQKSRLFLDLRDTFRSYGWLGSDKKDITKHKIVPRFPIAPDEGVSAEFALRNGRLHVLETVDFRTSTISAKKQEAMSKALVFDLAFEIEQKAVEAYVIVAGTSQPETRTTVNLLNRYAEHVLHWEDRSDMNGLMQMMATATGRPMLDLPTKH